MNKSQLKYVSSIAAVVSIAALLSTVVVVFLLTHAR